MERIALAVDYFQSVCYTSNMNTCINEDCHSAMVAKKLCDKHYRRLKKYGTTQLPVKQIKLCSENCSSTAKTRGMCDKHYTRLLRHGDASVTSRNIGEGFRYTDLPEYNVWCNMKARCYKKSNKQYHNYGGRGITVCDSWVNSFPNFYKDMGSRPTSRHSIDRIDNNKGYSPENCRWVTNKTNCNNKRINKYIVHDGIKLSYAQWSEKLGGDTHLVSDRIRVLGWSEQRAVTTPPRSISKQ